jgi:hypothetical protein
VSLEFKLYVGGLLVFWAAGFTMHWWLGVQIRRDEERERAAGADRRVR